MFADSTRYQIVFFSSIIFPQICPAPLKATFKTKLIVAKKLKAMLLLHNHYKTVEGTLLKENKDLRSSTVRIFTFFRISYTNHAFNVMLFRVGSQTSTMGKPFSTF